MTRPKRPATVLPDVALRLPLTRLVDYPSDVNVAATWFTFTSGEFGPSTDSLTGHAQAPRPEGRETPPAYVSRPAAQHGNSTILNPPQVDAMNSRAVLTDNPIGVALKTAH